MPSVWLLQRFVSQTDVESRGCGSRRLESLTRVRRTRCVWAGLAAGIVMAGGALPANARAQAWSPLTMELAPGCGTPAALAIRADHEILGAWPDCEGSPSPGTTLGMGRAGETFERTGAVRGRVASATPSLDRGWLLLARAHSREVDAVDVTENGRILRTSRLIDSRARSLRLASARDGTAAFAWVAENGLRLRVRVRRPGVRRFEAPVTLARARPLRVADEPAVNGLAVVVRPRGGIAVFWGAGNALHARIRPPGARRFGATMRVGPSSTLTWTDPVYSPDGRLSVVWHSNDGGEEQNRPSRIRVAVLAPRLRRFMRTRVPGVGAWGEQLIMGGTVARAQAVGDRVLVAYTLADSGLHVGELTRQGTLAGVHRIDDHGVLGALAGTPTGAALVTWMHRPQSFPGLGSFPLDSQVYAALGAPGEAMLGVGDAVAPIGTAGGAALLDPTGTQAVVSWSTVDPAVPLLTGTSLRTVP